MDNLFRESQSCLLRLLNQHRVFTVGAGWAVGAQASGGADKLITWDSRRCSSDTELEGGVNNTPVDSQQGSLMTL